MANVHDVCVLQAQKVCSYTGLSDGLEVNPKGEAITLPTKLQDAPRITLPEDRSSLGLFRELLTPVTKNPPANAGDARDIGSIPGSGRSPGEGNGSPL